MTEPKLTAEQAVSIGATLAAKPESDPPEGYYESHYVGWQRKPLVLTPANVPYLRRRQ